MERTTDEALLQLIQRLESALSSGGARLIVAQKSSTSAHREIEMEHGKRFSFCSRDHACMSRACDTVRQVYLLPLPYKVWFVVRDVAYGDSVFEMKKMFLVQRILLNSRLAALGSWTTSSRGSSSSSHEEWNVRDEQLSFACEFSESQVWHEQLLIYEESWTDLAGKRNWHVTHRSSEALLPFL